jgi:hypothetical protein
VGATAKQQQTHPKVMTKMVKKCSTDQRFIRKRNTAYKIHTLGRTHYKVAFNSSFLNLNLFLKIANTLAP